MSIDMSHYHENTSRVCKNLSVGPSLSIRFAI
jgi:hypothetical protein